MVGYLAGGAWHIPPGGRPGVTARELLVDFETERRIFAPADMKAHTPLQRPLLAGRRRPIHAAMRTLLNMVGRLRRRWERQSSRRLACWAPRPTAGAHRLQSLGLLTSSSALGGEPRHGRPTAGAGTTSPS